MLILCIKKNPKQYKQQDICMSSATPAPKNPNNKNWQQPNQPKQKPIFSVDFHSGIFAWLFSFRVEAVNIWHPALRISLQQWGFDVQIILLYLWHVIILTSILLVSNSCYSTLDLSFFFFFNCARFSWNRLQLRCPEIRLTWLEISKSTELTNFRFFLNILCV